MRKPFWLKTKLVEAGRPRLVYETLSALRLNTVCAGARCPNRDRCYARGTATFMIMGDHCTRTCLYCAVPACHSPAPLDPEEPGRIAEAVRRLGLNHVVVTSVTRDDLEDGGAEHFAKVIRALKGVGRVRVEVLIPDFKGDLAAVHRVLEAEPDVFSHNIETVPRLYPIVRPEGRYAWSLLILEAACNRARSPGADLRKMPVVKSGMMLGMGETAEEVSRVMDDLLQAGCEVLTLGQYLQPTRSHMPVQEFITPAQFAEYRRMGLAKGFRAVLAGPLVRSSFHAAEIFRHILSSR